MTTTINMPPKAKEKFLSAADLRSGSWYANTSTHELIYVASDKGAGDALDLGEYGMPERNGTRVVIDPSNGFIQYGLFDPSGTYREVNVEINVSF